MRAKIYGLALLLSATIATAQPDQPSTNPVLGIPIAAPAPRPIYGDHRSSPVTNPNPGGVTQEAFFAVCNRICGIFSGYTPNWSPNWNKSENSANPCGCRPSPTATDHGTFQCVVVPRR